MVACVDEGKVRFARSHCVLRRRRGPLVPGHVFAPLLALKILHKKIDDTLVKISTTKVCITCACLSLKQQRHIEGASTHIIDEEVVM